jgi:hypothetical protein
LYLFPARLKRNKTYFLPGCGFALISWVIGGASCEPIALFILTNNSDMKANYKEIRKVWEKLVSKN